MYLLIQDDLQIFKTEILKDNDFNEVDEGVLDIIDMDNEKIYVSGEWMEIDEI